MHLPILSAQPAEAAFAPSPKVERDAALPSKTTPVVFGEVYGDLQKSKTLTLPRIPEAEESGDIADTEGEELANEDGDIPKPGPSKEDAVAAHDIKPEKEPAVFKSDRKPLIETNLPPRSARTQAVERVPADIDPDVPKSVAESAGSTSRYPSNPADPAIQPARNQAETSARQQIPSPSPEVGPVVSGVPQVREILDQKSMSSTHAFDTGKSQSALPLDTVNQPIQHGQGMGSGMSKRSESDKNVPEKMPQKPQFSVDARLGTETNRPIFQSPNVAAETEQASLQDPVLSNESAASKTGATVRTARPFNKTPAAPTIPSAREMRLLNSVSDVSGLEPKFETAPKAVEAERVGAKLQASPVEIRNVNPDARLALNEPNQIGRAPVARQFSKAAPTEQAPVDLAGSDPVRKPEVKAPAPQIHAKGQVEQPQASDKVFEINTVNSKSEKAPKPISTETTVAKPLFHTTNVGARSPQPSTPTTRSEPDQFPPAVTPASTPSRPNQTGRPDVVGAVPFENASRPSVMPTIHPDPKQNFAASELQPSSEKSGPAERGRTSVQTRAPDPNGKTAPGEPTQTVPAKATPDKVFPNQDSSLRKAVTPAERSSDAHTGREPTQVAPASNSMPQTTEVKDRRRSAPLSPVAAEKTAQAVQTPRPITARSPEWFPQPAQVRPESVQGEPLAPMAETSPFRSEQALLSTPVGSQEVTHIRADSARIPVPQIVEIVARQPDRPVEIRLSPEELGRVRMTLSTTETGVTVVILTERIETMDLMRRHIDQLAQEFRRMGYEDVGFDFRNSGSGAQEGGRNPDGNNDLGATSLADAGETTPTAPPQRPTRVPTTGLDLRV